MSESDPCPQCGTEYQRLGSHWSRSATCDFPPLGTERHELLKGLLLAQGSSGKTGNYPSVRVSSSDKAALEWLGDQLGIFSNRVTLRKSADEVRESFEERGWDVTGEVKPEYQLRLVSHPELHEYYSEWYEKDEDGNRTKLVPETLSRSPALLKVWYLLNGRLTHRSESVHAAFPITSVAASERLISQLHEPFNPHIHEDSSYGGSQTLLLWDSEAFFEYIGDAPAGLEDRWPDETETLSSEAESSTCPSCGRSYSYLSGHWDKSSTCDFPELTARNKGILNALLIGGAYLNQTGSTKRPHLLFDSTDKPLLNWLDDELGLLVSGVSTRTLGDDAAERIGTVFGTSPDEEETRDIYRLQTRSHPYLSQAADWAGREIHSDGPPDLVLPDGLSTPPILYKTLYLHRGSYIQYPEGAMNPVLRLTRIPTTHEELLDLFSPFDPRIASTNSEQQVLVIGTSQEFFDYIGEPIPEHEDLWGNS